MTDFVPASEIRCQFSKAMSDMYQQEVPLYSDLMSLVSDVNNNVLQNDASIKAQLQATGELDRLDIERHGAIRLGLPSELFQMRRLFAVMGMQPVDYYDLAPSGVPVHSTAFRAIAADELNISPFRVFTSLLRLELINNLDLRQKAEIALKKRQIFTSRVLELIDKYEQQGGLDTNDAQEFVKEALETFRWHAVSPVSQILYNELHDQHRLIADVVGFQGPHINHLTPRTLDIDAVQSGMNERGITPKAVVEGPPRRNCPILLRQTSFKALQEKVTFTDEQGKASQVGQHTARFGEIEQRGVALTPKGRAMYDDMLETARQASGGAPDENNAQHYMQVLQESFAKFPDTYAELYEQGLAYFYVKPSQNLDKTKLSAFGDSLKPDNIPQLVKAGLVDIEPIVYEDFLPVSAAGIFQSNLGENGQGDYDEQSSQALFEQALGSRVIEADGLYQATQQQSLTDCIKALNKTLAKSKTPA